MEKQWKPLIYKDIDLSSYFEYNDDGQIRNKFTKKLVRQSGESIVLNADQEYFRINRYYMVHGHYNETPRADKGTKRKPYINYELLERMIEKKVEEVVLRVINQKFGQS